MPMPRRTFRPLARALVILSGALVLAPQAAAQDTTPPQFLAPLPRLKRNPIRACPQSAILRVVTDEPTQLILEFDDGTGPPRRELVDKELRTNHTKIPVVGMKHGVATTIRVIARDAAGNESVYGGPIVFPARFLPTSFPPLSVQLVDPARREPGYTLFTARSGAVIWMIVLDVDGDVVWYFYSPATGGPNVELMPDGNFLWSRDRHAVELTRLGNPIHLWYPARVDGGAGAEPGAILVDTDSFHHELTLLPEGQDADFLALSSELRVYDGFPIDEVDPTMTADGVNVVGDVIVEFKRDGTLVRETKLLDVLDPFRMCYDSLNTFWSGPESIYNAVSPGIVTRDVFHANAVTIDWSDDTYVVSCRHQDAFVKITRDTGQIVWIHGAHERWNPPWDQYLLTPVGDEFEWQFHQHAVEVNPFGNFVMFDNGNWRAIPPAPGQTLEQSYSRAVEFHVDPVAMTTSELWSFGGPPGAPDHIFSRFLGDADSQPMDNVLVVNGGIYEVGVPATYGQIIELTRTRPPVEVFRAEVHDPANVRSWTIYRAERIPTLYP
jgi:arylsulfate sulfotransferase